MDTVRPFNNVERRNEDDITDVKTNNQGDFSGENDESVNAKVNGTSAENEDHIRFRPIFKAVQENDWKGIEDFINKDPKVLTAKVKVYKEETVFHIITRNTDVPFSLMEKLASMVDPISLDQMQNASGRSPIFHAALYGNINAAKAFVGRNKELPNISKRRGFLPIHEAARQGHKQMVNYLLSVTRIPLDDELGVLLIVNLISSGLYGIALDLLKQNPKLARERNADRGRILELLSNKPQAFESGNRLGYWKRLIYNWIPVKEECISCPQSLDGDVENPVVKSKKLAEFKHLGILRQFATTFDAFGQILNFIFWSALVRLAPGIKCICDLKLTHIQTLEIVKIMCHEGDVWSAKEASQSLQGPILTAAKLGIYEIVKEILNAFFYSYKFQDKNQHRILHLAVLHRQGKVFNLLIKMNIESWYWKAAKNREKFDNILHIAGSLVPSSDVPGAALQMQRELQWFKAVESYVHPTFQEQKNASDETPWEMFTKRHENLVKEGEKWMKDTAQSCTVVAALIITVVFAAAFTIPGGNGATGIPNFLHEPSFLIFAISDALGLISSTTSLLMFLGILTSRYSQEDFLVSLPKKLIIGLITMFFSIASMIVAFGSTIYLVLSDPWKWIIIPIALLGCIPVTLFALLRFPLLVEMFLSTYRPSLFQAKK